jgi:hypothetical protein
MREGLRRDKRDVRRVLEFGEVAMKTSAQETAAACEVVCTEAATDLDWLRLDRATLTASKILGARRYP